MLNDSDINLPILIIGAGIAGIACAQRSVQIRFFPASLFLNLRGTELQQLQLDLTCPGVEPP